MNSGPGTRQADELEAWATGSQSRPVTQVTAPAERRLAGYLDRDVGQIRESLRLGATAMASRLLGGAAPALEAAA